MGPDMKPLHTFPFSMATQCVRVNAAFLVCRLHTTALAPIISMGGQLPIHIPQQTLKTATKRTAAVVSFISWTPRAVHFGAQHDIGMRAGCGVKKNGPARTDPPHHQALYRTP